MPGLDKEAWMNRAHSTWSFIKARPRQATIGAIVLLLAILASWTWFYLRPDRWHYYTDESSFAHLAKDVKPRFVVWEDAHLAAGDINKPSDRFEPVISPDGVKLVFARGALR